MNKFKSFKLFVVFLLIFQLAPIQTFANDEKNQGETRIIFSEMNDEVALISSEKELIEYLQNGTEVTLLEEGANISSIRYIHNEKEIEQEGYIENIYLVTVEDYDTLQTTIEKQELEKDEESEKIFELENSANQDANTDIDSEESGDQAISSDFGDEAKIENQEENSEMDDEKGSENQDVDFESDDEQTPEEPNIEKDESNANIEKNTEKISKEATIQLLSTGPLMNAVALKHPTNVYEETDMGSRIVKTYQQGHILLLRNYNAQWYTSSVITSGKKVPVYIAKKDVEEIQSQKKVELYANEESVHVYDRLDTSSKKIKTYSYGQILKVRTLTKDWYEAHVFINGEKQVGFIQAKDLNKTPKTMQGIALKDKTHVYTTTSKTSKTLKSYNKGHVLKYKAYNNQWYQATVYINKKPVVGYIAKSDIGKMSVLLDGYAKVNQTKFYSNPSTNAQVLKTYKKGDILKYRRHDNNWFVSSVIRNGKKQTAYVSSKDVTFIPPLLEGFALKSKTSVYSSTSVNGKILKSYSLGSNLKYRPYNKNWYSATVYINGKATKGYISAKDVSEMAPLMKLYASASPTKVFTSMSKNSKVLKSYSVGKLLKLRPYNKDWYKATVIINGKKQTGYVAKKDTSTTTPVAKNIVNPNRVYSYNQMVNDIKAIAKSYPHLITYHSIGKSEYGRDIYAVSIGKGKPTAFINGSHHAREWLTTNLNMYMIEQYAKAYYRNEKIIGYDAKKILNGTTLWFVPMVNPDGVTLQQEGLKAFPKSIHSSLIRMNNGSQNFKRWKANAKGIDLNRQYDAGWSLINSPKSPSYQNYKGSKPVEAKETKAIVAFTNKIDPESAVAYHSTGQILYWNYLQTGANYQRDLGMAKVISKLTGYSLFYPVGRPSGGGYTDWFIQAKKRPGFTPEIAKYVFESNPPLSEFAGAWNENKAVGLYVAQESLRLYNKRK